MNLPPDDQGERDSERGRRKVGPWGGDVYLHPGLSEGTEGACFVRVLLGNLWCLPDLNLNESVGNASSR